MALMKLRGEVKAAEEAAATDSRSLARLANEPRVANSVGSRHLVARWAPRHSRPHASCGPLTSCPSKMPW